MASENKQVISSLYDEAVNCVDLDDNDTKKEFTKDQRFLRDATDMIFDVGVVKATDRRSKVVDFYHPHELKDMIDLEIKDKGDSSDKLLSLLKDTFKYSVLPANPRFFNALFAGQDVHGLVGQWLTDCINVPAYTYEVAPVFVLMENEVIKRLRESIGYVNGDGVFTPGGSTANMYAMNVARYRKYGEEIKMKGMHGLPRMALFTSEHSHYWIKKGAAYLGFGTDSVTMVKCDERGKMLVKDLEKKIIEAKERGDVPLFVNATGGTTVFGAFDPIDDIADICEKYELWLHVDGCWGGSVSLSRKWRHLLKGVERSNSMSWDQHKMMGVPFQCSVLLLRDNIGLLHNTHCVGARSSSYIFQQDKFYDVSYDTGDKVVQCNRKVDACKLWLMFKAKGNLGFEEETNTKFDNSRYFTQLVREREGFKLVIEPECINVSFWYIPPCIRELPEDDDFKKLLEKVAPVIKERMVKAGTLLIGYQPLLDIPNFFRIIFSNPKTTRQDLEFVIDEIVRLGNDITVSDLLNY
ncbi:cysteine sulfinic acid decarboxylase-like [Glandiceps talaboti]